MKFSEYSESEIVIDFKETLKNCPEWGSTRTNPTTRPKVDYRNTDDRSTRGRDKFLKGEPLDFVG